MANPNRIAHKFKPWIALRQIHRLSHAHVQMAREMQMDPRGLHLSVKRDDPLGKLPYEEMIEALYKKQFGRDRPEEIKTVEQMAAEHLAKRQAKKNQKQNAEIDSPPER